MPLMQLTRRQFLTASAAAGLLAPASAAGQSDEAASNGLLGVRLEPFVDPLAIPPVLRPSTGRADEAYCQIKMSEFRQQLHRDLPPTLVWGFERCTPGPTIEARCGQTLVVEWLNQLPERHRLTVDHTLDGAGKDVPEVRTAIHLHGGHTSAESDGYPEHWITPGQTQRTVYPNRQLAATLWYHDHAMGITRLNALMGLAGLYVVRSPEEDWLGLPSGRYEIPLILQDRTLGPRGHILYPLSGNPDAPSVPEFFGTHILVNGRVSPYLDVEPRKYRFRFLNASNGRIFQLAMEPEQDFVLIGSDGGLLPAPVARGELFIAPGERIDVIVDFRGRDGKRINLVNYAPAPFPSGGGPVPGLAMQFRVSRPLQDKIDKSDIPATLTAVARLRESSASKTRRLKLVEIMPQNGQPHRVLLDGRRFMDPVSEDPIQGSIEIWELINTTLDAHPIHLHAIHFQLLDRRPFDVRRYQRTSEIALLHKSLPPEPGESGWKDTILCPPGQVTRIIAPFTAEPGRFVWHCHTLEHEDNEMMRPYVIQPAS